MKKPCLCLPIFLVVFSCHILSAQNFITAWQISNNLNATGRSVISDDRGNLYQTGVFSGTSDFDPGPGVVNLVSQGNVDAFVAKYDSTGSLVWARDFGAAYIDQGFDVAVDRYGNVYTSGYFRDSIDCDPGIGTYYVYGVGNNDAFLCKLDSNGNFLWANGWGGSLTDYPYSIALDDAGTCYVTGYFENSVDFDPGAGVFMMNAFGSRDCFVSKFDPAGNFIWAKQLGGTSADEGNEIMMDGNKNIILTGSYAISGDFDPGPGTFTLTSGGGFDAFICKLDSAGNFMWATSFTSTSLSWAEGIIQDIDKNLYFAGHFLVNVDADPGAGTYSFTSASGSADVMVVKLDSSGNFIWANQIGGNSLDYAYDIRLDNAGNVFVAGTFFSTVDFDPGSGTANLTSNGSTDNFILHLDTAGNYVSAVSFGGPSSETIYALAIDKFCNIYSTGDFYDTVDFDTGPGMFELAAPGTNVDAFIARHQYCSLMDVEPLSSANNLNVYPNPSAGSFTINTTNPCTESMIRVSDLHGRTIFEKNIPANGSNEIYIQLSNVEAGVYMLRLIGKDNIMCKKLMIVK